jgi:hypothetical protein
MFTVSLLSVPIIEFIVNWISHLSHLMLHSVEIASAQSGNSVQRSDARIGHIMWRKASQRMHVLAACNRGRKIRWSGRQR